MLKPELPFQPRFFSDVLAKRRCQCSHDRCGQLNNQAERKESFTADALGERVVVDEHVEDGLREIGVQLS